MNLIRWQQPTLTAWPRYGRLTDLRDEIDRLFEGTLAEFVQTPNLLSGWTPAFDVFEDKDNFTIVAELPGMKKEDIEVSLHNGSLSVSGERKNERRDDAEVYRAERFYGRFQRTITLPTPVATEKVKAQYKDGILTITLPKTEEAKPKHIDVAIN